MNCCSNSPIAAARGGLRDAPRAGRVERDQTLTLLFANNTDTAKENARSRDVLPLSGTAADLIGVAVFSTSEPPVLPICVTLTLTVVKYVLPVDGSSPKAPG